MGTGIPGGYAGKGTPGKDTDTCFVPSTIPVPLPVKPIPAVAGLTLENDVRI